MRRAIQLAANLYPQIWRQRYGEEFDALLEDLKPGQKEFLDVLRGALKMQMTNAAIYWKLAGGLAVVGAIVATAASFSVPRIYESTAVMRITPRQVPEGSAQDAVQDQAASQVNAMEEEILSRTSLLQLVTRPDFSLYPRERSLEPVEDVILTMRSRDIRIRRLDPQGTAFAVSFSYPDQQKAQAVVRRLTAQFIEANVGISRNHARIWQIFWPQAAPPPGPDLEVIDPASRTEKPIWPNRTQFAAVGLALGLALGLVVAAAIQRPAWTLQMAGFAVGCCVLAFAISWLLPENYTSSAVMRLTPPLVPASLTGNIAAPSLADKLRKLQEVVLSDTSLNGIITSVKLDLYREHRQQKPMDEIAAALRRDITVRPVNPSHSEFRISFSYPDPEKAQNVVRELVTGFTEQNVFDERERARASGDAKAIDIAEHKGGVQTEVLDPASDRQEPVSPNRMAIALAGFAAGLLLGAVTLRMRQRRSQRLRMA